VEAIVFPKQHVLSVFSASLQETRKSISALRKGHSSLSACQSTPDRQISTVLFTVESFGGLNSYSDNQRQNIVAYMKELASLCAKAGFSLLDQQGQVKVKGHRTLYSELCLRTPSCLLARWKKMAKGAGGKFGSCNSFGEYVLVTFRRLLPSVGAAAKGAVDPSSSLRQFLVEVDQEALPVLRGRGA